MSEPNELKVTSRRKRTIQIATSQASPAKKSLEGTGLASPYFKHTAAIQGIDPEKNTNFQVSTSCEPADNCTKHSSQNKAIKLLSDFYDQSAEALAKSLLGKVLVHILGSGDRVSGTIVETESYLGGEDHASHSYNGKRTNRNEPMFMAPGTAYVYHIYGMYTCFNVSSKGEGAAVLIRGLEAMEGAETMKELRGAKRADRGEKLKHHQLCNGPSKLTMALDIQKQDINKQDLSTSSSIWIENGEMVPEQQIVKCPRIGIKCAEEWVKAPLRFYIKQRPGVSLVNKIAEGSTTTT